MPKVSIVIDGQHVDAEQGRTILEVARAREIEIPTLCHLRGVSNIGTCRLCVVEVAGAHRLMPACITAVTDGMEIQTHSPTVQRCRRVIMELLFAERNHVCAVCVADGHCELQSAAADVGMDHVRFGYRYPKCGVDVTHQQFGIDHNRCILCSRCVRACHELERAPTWGVVGRGVETYVATEWNKPWGDATTCTSCSKCVAACPTGAIFYKGMTVAEMPTDRDRELLLYQGNDG